MRPVHDHMAGAAVEIDGNFTVVVVLVDFPDAEDRIVRREDGDGLYSEPTIYLRSRVIFFSL